MQIYDFRNQLKFPNKYIDDKVITLRSSYEIELAIKLDLNKNVLEWGVENIKIKYFFPYKLTLNHMGIIKQPKGSGWHKYFIDFYVKYISSAGKIEIALIEVKAENMLERPKNTGNQRSYMYQLFQNNMNRAKWIAGVNWCKDKTKETKIKYNFILFTLKDIRAFGI